VTFADGGFAGAVAFEVYASGYGELKAWAGGLPTFDPLPGVPVYAAAAEGGKVRGWKGLSSCKKGALAPADHPLNVAFSPYTAVVRLAKRDTHQDARIDLDPFWVGFGSDDLPLAPSCKVKWKIQNAKLTHGLLLICDRKGVPVFCKGLGAEEL